MENFALCNNPAVNSESFFCNISVPLNNAKQLFETPM